MESRILTTVLLATCLLGLSFASVSAQDGGYTMIDLGTLGGPQHSTHIYDMNNLNQIVGSSQTASGETHAFLWEKRGDERFGDIGR